MPIFPVALAGTLLCALAALILATVARDWLAEHDARWWLWVAVAGFLLGATGMIATHRRLRV